MRFCNFFSCLIIISQQIGILIYNFLHTRRAVPHCRSETTRGTIVDIAHPPCSSLLSLGNYTGNYSRYCTPTVQFLFAKGEPETTRGTFHRSSGPKPHSLSHSHSHCLLVSCHRIIASFIGCRFAFSGFIN